MPHQLKNILRKTAYFISIITVLFVFLSFTDIPYKAYHGLSIVEDELRGDPEYIIVMGGDGMPSPGGLMRTYFGIEKAKKYSSATIILALPYNNEDSTEQLELMKDEFVQKSIDSNRIIYAAEGYNTRTQALEISDIIQNKDKAIMIVTSPEHTYRAVASFKKVGFTHIGSSPTFERPPDKETLEKEVEKDNIRNLNLRYNMWSYMQYEIIVIREYIAIAYYWFKGWI